MTKSNKQFMIFSAINIIFVVDAHAWTALSVFTRYLSYNMFFMQAFIFVSGYFFKWDDNKSIIRFVQKKLKNMIVPYYIWWFIYALFIWGLWKIVDVKIGYDITWDTLLLGPWKGGEFWVFNNPSWFVCCLFLIQLCYGVVRKICNRIWNDWVCMVLLTIISTYGTYYVTVNAVNHDLCNLYRTAILIWFYHFGIFYRKYMEKWFAKCSGYIVCGICLVFIALFNGVCGFNEFYFNSLTWNQPGVECAGVLGGLRPIVTGVIGIAFWLKISQILVPAVGENKLINFISDHTFDIMMNHVVFIWLTNLIFVWVNRYYTLVGFDQGAAVWDPWYRWSDSHWSNLMYFMAGMIGSTLLAWLTDMFKMKLYEKMHIY